MSINLRLENKEKKHLFSKNIVVFIASFLIVSFVSYFFINLHSTPKQYQKFAVFSASTLVDDNKFNSRIRQCNFDDIYQVNVGKYDENSESFSTNFSTNGLYNSDIFILSKKLVDLYSENFIRISSKFEVDSYDIYSEVAIKCYDCISHEGLLSKYFISYPDEDLYFCINQNSYHYKSSKKHSTNYAISFIEGLKNENL